MQPFTAIFVSDKCKFLTILSQPIIALVIMKENYVSCAVKVVPFAGIIKF